LHLTRVSYGAGAVAVGVDTLVVVKGPIDLGQSYLGFSDLITVSGQQKNIPPSREVSGGGSEFGDRRKTAKIHFRLISQKRRKPANDPANEKIQCFSLDDIHSMTNKARVPIPSKQAGETLYGLILWQQSVASIYPIYFESYLSVV
jgi:hypothetical protein